MATTIEKLPDHLLSNILVRVPARTLAQMRSVSKPLNAFLSQPSFIQSHLHRSIKPKDEILIVFRDIVIYEVTTHPSRSPHVELPNFIQLPVYDDPSRGYKCEGYEFVGAVSGLICFHYVTDWGYIVHIWNPSISALLELPDSRISGEFEKKYRFGYDPINDDYKVVRLAIFVAEPEDYVLVEVFSMRKGCWKTITERFPAYYWIFGEDKVCGDGHDGRLHWLCYDNDGRKLEAIVAYDLGAETISEICLPVANNLNRKNVLGVLGGKLCLMSCLKDRSCEVWLMNEYGNAGSWAKHHVFSQFRANNVDPFGFTLSNEFLFLSFNVLSLYDPVADKVKSFMFKVDLDARIVPYIDSFVWITPRKSKKNKWCMATSMVVTREGKIVSKKKRFRGKKSMVSRKSA